MVYVIVHFIGREKPNRIVQGEWHSSCPVAEYKRIWNSRFFFFRVYEQSLTSAITVRPHDPIYAHQLIWYTKSGRKENVLFFKFKAKIPLFIFFERGRKKTKMCQSNGKEVEKNRRDGFGAGLCANRFNKHRSVAGAQLHHFTASTTAVSILLGGRVATRDNNTTSSSGILRSLSCSAPSSSFLCSCIDTHRHPSDGTTPAFENRSKCFVPVSLFLNQRFPLPHPCSQTLGVLRVWESLAFFFFTSTSVCWESCEEYESSSMRFKRDFWEREFVLSNVPQSPPTDGGWGALAWPFRNVYSTPISLSL